MGREEVEERGTSAAASGLGSPAGVPVASQKLTIKKLEQGVADLIFDGDPYLLHEQLKTGDFVLSLGFQDMLEAMTVFGTSSRDSTAEIEAVDFVALREEPVDDDEDHSDGEDHVPDGRKKKLRVHASAQD